MKTPRPAIKDMDALLAYLPRLYAPGFKPIERWHGGQPDANGVIEWPWPEYDKTVEDFFHLAAAECWRDYHYDMEKVGSLIRDQQAIRSASLDQIKSILTFCVRGERFSDGFWGSMVEEGVIRAVLERLQEIRNQES